MVLYLHQRVLSSIVDPNKNNLVECFDLLWLACLSQLAVAVWRCSIRHSDSGGHSTSRRCVGISTILKIPITLKFSIFCRMHSALRCIVVLGHPHFIKMWHCRWIFRFAISWDAEQLRVREACHPLLCHLAALPLSSVIAPTDSYLCVLFKGRSA